MEEKNKKLLYAIMFDREKEFRTILQQCEEQLDTETYDEKSNNLIHFLAYNNKLNMIKVAIQVFSTRYTDDPTLQERLMRWVNIQNSKGLTPVFYAVYNGNLVGS